MLRVVGGRGIILHILKVFFRAFSLNIHYSGLGEFFAKNVEKPLLNRDADALLSTIATDETPTWMYGEAHSFLSVDVAVNVSTQDLLMNDETAGRPLVLNQVAPGSIYGATVNLVTNAFIDLDMNSSRQNIQVECLGLEMGHSNWRQTDRLKQLRLVCTKGLQQLYQVSQTSRLKCSHWLHFVRKYYIRSVYTNAYIQKSLFYAYPYTLFSKLYFPKIAKFDLQVITLFRAANKEVLPREYG